MKLIIAGTRTFHDYDMMKRCCEKYLPLIKEVVSGGAYGADRLGERWAMEHKIYVRQFLPDWSKGRAAGPIRNQQMAEYADAAIIFWDGKSRGAADMAKRMKHKIIEVIIYNPQPVKPYKLPQGL